MSDYSDEERDFGNVMYVAEKVWDEIAEKFGREFYMQLSTVIDDDQLYDYLETGLDLNLYLARTIVELDMNQSELATELLISLFRRLNEEQRIEVMSETIQHLTSGMNKSLRNLLRFVSFLKNNFPEELDTLAHYYYAVFEGMGDFILAEMYPDMEYDYSLNIVNFLSPFKSNPDLLRDDELLKLILTTAIKSFKNPTVHLDFEPLTRFVGSLSMRPNHRSLQRQEFNDRFETYLDLLKIINSLPAYKRRKIAKYLQNMNASLSPEEMRDALIDYINGPLLNSRYEYHAATRTEKDIDEMETDPDWRSLPGLVMGSFIAEDARLQYLFRKREAELKRLETEYEN